MKKVVSFIVAAMFMAAGSAMAQEALKIGYVNMRAAMNECKAGKDAKAKLEKVVKDRQAKLDKEKKKLETMQADFEKKAAAMSDADKQEKQKEFQEKVQAYQKQVMEAQKEINEKEGDVTKRIVADAKKAIAEVAKEGQFTLVIEKTDTSILYSKDGLDLTSKVIDKMDE